MRPGGGRPIRFARRARMVTVLIALKRGGISHCEPWNIDARDRDMQPGHEAPKSALLENPGWGFSEHSGEHHGHRPAWVCLALMPTDIGFDRSGGC